MALDALRFASVLLTAVAMAAGFAHLMELPNKIGLPRDAYLTVQQIYRGWALLGFAVVGALITTAVSAWMLRRRRRAFYLTAAAALCIALSLVLFFLFTYPANQQTSNWTVLPENWEQLRRQWEYSHAAGAVLYLLALGALTLSLLADGPEPATGLGEEASSPSPLVGEGWGGGYTDRGRWGARSPHRRPHPPTPPSPTRGEGGSGYPHPNPPPQGGGRKGKQRAATPAGSRRGGSAPRCPRGGRCPGRGG